ncbi:MAG: response regulator transcription factor [Phycisphaerae bacterium]|nr:response regulator transcription factor [Phycisphaerae bacterium]
MADDLSGKKILLVDDDRDILQAMEATLTDEGVDLLVARDGNTAIDLAQRENPDLVVLDMMLPKRSGFLVLEKLSRGKDKSEMPLVIMITANLGTRHKKYAESLGVNEYIHKPFRMEKLVEKIKALFAEQDD